MKRFGRIRKDQSERGAAAVEFAIILPVLVLLVFGIFEFGMYFRESLTIASATASAARTGATMGDRDEADIAILQALEAGLYDQVDASDLIFVEIYKADPVTGARLAGFVDKYKYKPNLACKWKPCPDPDFGGAPVGTWTPDTRDVTLQEGGGGLDVLGVRVKYRHYAITGLIPGVDRNFFERALVRLEPALFESS